MAGSQNVGSFIPTTNIWDVQRIYEVDVKSPEFKELLVRLYQNVNNIALSLNSRDAGFYDNTEFINGQTFFPNPTLSSATAQTPTRRQVFRKTIDFGSLPNAATKSVAHGINFLTTFSATRIYGAATDPIGLTYIPLPFSSPVLANNIALDVDAINVNVTTGSNRTNYTISYIVIEYLKS